jgi:hypothetical protein
MFEKQYLYNKGINYRGFFVCPIQQPNGFTYRCFSPEDSSKKIQLGSGLFKSIAEAIEAGQKFLDREWQYRNEISYYQNLLSNQAISQEDYQLLECSLDQAIWGLS